MQLLPGISYANLRASLKSVEGAQSEIRQNITSHAQRHFLELDTLRTALDHERAINDGIARATSQV